MKVICVVLDQKDKAPLFAESCLRFTPQVSLGKEGAVFLEVSQVEHLMEAKTILARLQVLLKKLSLKGKTVIAEDPPTALSFAKFSTTHKNLLPLDCLYDFSDPFGDSENQREIEKILFVLKQIGLQTLGDFLRLSRSDLILRFGAMAYHLSNWVHFAENALWPKLKPIEVFVEKMDWSYEAACDGFESISFLLKTLVDRVMTRAFGRGERVLTFRLKLEIEKNSLTPEAVLNWDFHLHLPQGSSRNVLTLIREKLSFDLAQKPLLAPVISAEIEVLEVAPAFHRQGDLLHPKKEDHQEAWNSMISRLTQKLGSEQVFVAEPVPCYLPEKSWRRKPVPEVTPEATSMSWPFPERPTRIFRKPRLMNYQSNQLVCGAKAWKIMSWEGPEILSGQWWDDPFERMYFKVGTHTGEQLWLFRVPETQKMYLHGFFD